MWLWQHTMSAPLLPCIRSENSHHHSSLRHITIYRTTINVHLDTHSAAPFGALSGTAYNLPARPDQTPRKAVPHNTINTSIRLISRLEL